MLVGMDGTQEQLLSIGAFARLCRISVKRLRHYDELGLLPPAWIDPDSGYRYYRSGQARDATAIGLLRSLDVPLTAIGEILSGAPVSEALGDVRDRLEAELARRRRALDVLERILVDGMPSAEVELVTLPVRPVAVLRAVTDLDGIGRATSDCVSRLMGAFAAAGRELPVPLVGLFPLDMVDEVPVVVAAETEQPVPDTDADVLSGGRFASTTHVGPYDQIPLTVHGLLAWCAEHGQEPIGPVREVYLSDPARTPVEQLVTHLVIGLEDNS